MKAFKYYSALFLLMLSNLAFAQYQLSGSVNTEKNASERATLILDQSDRFEEADANGEFLFKNVSKGNHSLTVFMEGYQTLTKKVFVDGNTSIKIDMKLLETELDEVVVKGQKDNSFGITRLKAIDGTGIYEAKKTEVIVLEDMVANKAANNTRQIFAKIPGANIWESDCAGLQIGVATRGLSPNRNANFNTRQNGFDISADALGYPESYYTPPIQAVEKVELVRGAASLQYGTQFGGLVNFKIKQAPDDKVLEISTEQTYNTLGFYNSYVDAGGTQGKLSYFFFNRTAVGNCWRCNTDFNSVTSYVDIHYDFSDAFKAGIEYTRMNYLARQPGGLTEQLFEQDAKQSIRDRNWFQVGWNLLTLHMDYSFGPNLKLNSRTFSLVGNKEALGNLGRIDRPDDINEERDLLADRFTNWGNETRLIYNYLIGGKQSAFLIGTRYYKGFTHRRQGLGPNGDQPSFRYNNPNMLEGSDFDLPGINMAVFAENIITLSEKLSITPGVRYEYINTKADGYYRQTTSDLAGNVLFDTTILETLERKRDFLFGGVGVSYKMSEDVEFYGNFSQNYRSINFNDIRVNNPSLKVDENIKDEFGNNFDLGVRGNLQNVVNFDVSVFWLNYNDKIGTILVREPDPRFNNLVDRTYRYRTNIADARTYGVEAFMEANLFSLINRFQKREDQLSIFLNIGVIGSEYHHSQETAIEGNQVELVPLYSVKSGISYKASRFSSTLQITSFAKQYSDASNAAGPVPGAVEGLIPAYQVMDFSAKYVLGKSFNVQAGVNNLTDSRYFTRRAAGYPGPGILPSDGRSFYFTLGYNFDR
ncbi:TonB-dependent receptor domain-containing protein [Marinoscillum sp. MHG1-6]|uniref:TonB-dependent receptor domain-containing protein n=1 Tax=Marinoscillum sp. MHG1-6 TaxID=2959627 RepID=UPI0021572F57|nr:TonB-dependent receptor [Marinoscillum sp. MHG1-6]